MEGWAVLVSASLDEKFCSTAKLVNQKKSSIRFSVKVLSC